ncbi:MAG: hypothetical protein JNJ82_24570 [Opitutaceae bacterium]|nr:hypothetical protein [Opitutaceae bacterium]
MTQTPLTVSPTPRATRPAPVRCSRFFRSASSWILLWTLFCLPLPTTLLQAQPASAELAGTWSGLELAANGGGPRLFTLVLSMGTEGAGGGRLSGTWTARPVARARRGAQPAPVVERVEATYAVEAGILRLTRRPERGGPGYDCLLVFDAGLTSLAGVYAGGLKNIIPFCARRGDSPAPELLALVGLSSQEAAGMERPAGRPDPGEFARAVAAAFATGDYARAQALIEEARRGPAATPGSPPASTAPAAASGSRDVTAELLSLQRQMQEAASRRDVDEIKRLQKETQALRAEAAAQRRAASTPPTLTPSAGSGAGPCPKHLVAWVSQLDTYGASVAHFEGNIALANLFRPRLFVPHFGRPFAALTPRERAEVARDLQSRCLRDGTPFGNGSASAALLSVFQDTPGYTSVDAGLGGLALEVIADWNLRSVRDLGSELDAARVADFETKSSQLIAHLLPREQEETRQQLAALKSRNHGRRLLAELEGLGRAAAAGSAEALERLLRLPAYADAARLSAADRTPFDQRHPEVLTGSITAFFDGARREVLSLPPGLDHLMVGKAWFAANGQVLGALRGRPPADRFQQEFAAARAASYTAERDRFAREIAALDTVPAATAYGFAFELFSDKVDSPVWKELDAQRRAKVAAMERRDFIARTGGGPFGPDFPGALYLNALWRNDQPALEELDRRYREPFLAQLTLLEQVDYTPDLVEKVTGGAHSADRYRRLRRALLEQATLASGLLVAFAFDYEHVYPACMDPDPVPFKVLIQRETKVRNGLGLMVRTIPAGTTTVTHLVNRRHAAAVEDLGIADPDNRVVFEVLIGQAGSPVSYANVGTGLSRAMQEYPCSSEVIRRIEAGLLGRWEIFSARKRAIKQRLQP